MVKEESTDGERSGGREGCERIASGGGRAS